MIKFTYFNVFITIRQKLKKVVLPCLIVNKIELTFRGGKWCLYYKRDKLRYLDSVLSIRDSLEIILFYSSSYSGNIFHQYNNTIIFHSRSPVDSILDAVLTVSPKRQ